MYYQIKIEGEYIIMNSNEIIETIKRGYEYRITIPDENIEIGILSKNDRTIICYVSLFNNKRNHITDIEINKVDILTYKIYKQMTLQELLMGDSVSIEYL